MEMLRRTILATGLAAAAAWSCGSNGGTNPGPAAGSLAKQTGDAAVAAAGGTVILEVIVRDPSGSPLAGVNVNWVAVGGGSVNPTSSQTNSSGIAATTRTLGPNAGTQTTTAGVTGLTPVTFTATATIQGATQMSLSAGNNQTDTVRSTLAPFTVLVRDQTNAPVQGVIVNWAVTAGGGNVSAATSTTNASGIATITRTLGDTAKVQTAQATVTGLQGSPVAFSATATAGNAAQLSKTSGDGGTGGVGTTVPYVVTARDSYGNAKFGVTVNWAVTAGGGSITPPSNVTGTNGQASATRTLSGTAGAHTATATANVIPATVTFTTTATSAPATASVTVSNNTFTPGAVTIATGGTVTWNWAAGSVIHNVTFTPMAGAPANIANTSTGSFPRTFNTAGSFSYECTIHGAAMSGTVTVQ